MVRHCLWKMCATTGACIKPGCAARRLLCRKVNLLSCVARRPLCKVNLPICEARRRHFIMTCDIFGTGQTNILALCYLFGKTWPAHSSATQATEINTLDQITGKVIDVSRKHIPLKALMVPLQCVKLRGVVVQDNSLCSGFHHKKCGLGFLISTQVKNTFQ